MINIVTAGKNDIVDVMKIRLEMLREVNGLSQEHDFGEEFDKACKAYFEDGDQTTVLAKTVDGEVIGCASICYIDVMPTFSHPSGRRAHLMNVYTSAGYRRRGIAEKMVDMLISEAKGRGVSEVSLDATESGRPLYEKLGFSVSGEHMAICF